MSKFAQAVSELAGKKVRFYLGGEEGFVRGRVARVDGNMIFIQEAGSIHGTIHTVTINAEHVRYFEIELIGTLDD
ncbi:MAG: hypothetical protein ACE5JG_01000 [Planctomycetota bacterium]